MTDSVNTDHATSTLSSYQGRVMATRRQLVHTFGQPEFDSPEAIDEQSGPTDMTTQWVVDFNGRKVRIYDVVDDEDIYQPGDDEPYDWHVGATSVEAVEWVRQALVIS